MTAQDAPGCATGSVGVSGSRPAPKTQQTGAGEVWQGARACVRAGHGSGNGATLRSVFNRTLEVLYARSVGHSLLGKNIYFERDLENGNGPKTGEIEKVTFETVET
jgi:hypothetical protein